MRFLPDLLLRRSRRRSAWPRTAVGTSQTPLGRMPRGVFYSQPCCLREGSGDVTLSFVQRFVSRLPSTDRDSAPPIDRGGKPGACTSVSRLPQMVGNLRPPGRLCAASRSSGDRKPGRARRLAPLASTDGRIARSRRPAAWRKKVPLRKRVPLPNRLGSAVPNARLKPLLNGSRCAVARQMAPLSARRLTRLLVLVLHDFADGQAELL